MRAELKQLSDGVLAAIRGYVSKATSDLQEKIKAVEDKLNSLPTPEKGDEGPAGPQGERGEKGLDGVAGPQGERGEKGADGEKGLQGERGEPGLRGDIGPQGEKGEKGDPGVAGPQGERGEKGEKGDPGPVGLVGERGIDGRDGRDGKDGRDGIDGKDALNLDISFVKSLPENSQPGTYVSCNGGIFRATRSGWECVVDGIADIELSMNSDREVSISIKKSSGETVSKQFSVNVLLDKGVYKVDTEYEKGDGVSYDGSFWIAQRKTSAVPKSEDSGWRLAVKRGKDGRDGLRGEKGERGAEGRAGRDLTQMRFDGTKY